MNETHEKKAMKHKGRLDDLRRQIESTAEMEAAAWSDVASKQRGWKLVGKVRESLRSRLMSATKTAGYSSATGFGEIRIAVRAALLDEINRASLSLVSTALRGFQELCDANVNYLMNTSSDPDEPEWGKAGFLEFPFISNHREVLEATRRIRGESTQIQMKALRLAHCIRELEDIAYSEAMAIYEGVPCSKSLLNEKAKLAGAHQKLLRTLSSQVVDDVNDFYRNMETGSIHPYEIPIEISVAASSEDLRSIAQAFRRFGRDVRIPPYLSIQGDPALMKTAELALAKYHGAGLAFKLLSAWVMATDVVEERRQCAICYRHTSAIFRCIEHATKTQETREARLGKHVRPIYEAHFSKLAQLPTIKAVLANPLTVGESLSEALQSAAQRTKLSASAQTRAIYVAKQLREIYPIFNANMAQRAEQLFEEILKTVWHVESQPLPVGDGQMRVRDRQKESIRELLSLKGFLRAWCGNGRFSPEVHLQMLGYDRDHPVAKGAAIDSSVAQRTFLEQRAWEESLSMFMASRVPTAAQLQEQFQSGKSKKQVAEELGISLATVYNILKGRDSPRKRNHFGASAPRLKLQ